MAGLSMTHWQGDKGWMVGWRGMLGRLGNGEEMMLGRLQDIPGRLNG
jgi:hypothetical protein